MAVPSVTHWSCFCWRLQSRICCCRTWQQHGSHKAWVPFRSQLQPTAELSCPQQIKCQNIAVCIAVKWQRRLSAWREEKLRRIHAHRSALGLCTMWLVNFYKSSSGRQEKTRPVAILSTTLQPYFRFHLNATCVACARTYEGEELRKKKSDEIHFRVFMRSAYLQMFLKSYRQYLSHFWRISLCGGSVRKERGRGQQEE